MDSREMFLVMGYGETPMPEIELVSTLDEAFNAVARMVYGDPSPSELLEARADFCDFEDRLSDGFEWYVDFEIGGIHAWKVCGPDDLVSALAAGGESVLQCREDDRARFEAAMSVDSGLGGVTLFRNSDGKYVQREMQAAWVGWQAALATSADQSAGEGWKLVPVERSYEMRAKALIAFNTTEQSGKDRDDALDAAHRATLGAAPQVPAPVAPTDEQNAGRVVLTNDELNALTKERFGNMHQTYAEGFRRLMRTAIEINAQKASASSTPATVTLTDGQLLELRLIARTYNEVGFPKHAREFLARGASAQATALPVSDETVMLAAAIDAAMSQQKAGER
ncbi:hypothetical protein [Paraburkholderia sp. BL21I4N1]|uniref:hypothetical protein n=1 Tax=Paraburkholderia sp. BL21I4N1 TaxID=1938801 RepID=UPI000CFAE0FA|nr:hypothetical protein [Paraburkholderia sp. BL21I4N1]PQV51018.1 hypothetical protein B0G83_105381 [Paraburkholderia sp. BL21I4N1]